jgi:hypothetical protein
LCNAHHLRELKALVEIDAAAVAPRVSVTCVPLRPRLIECFERRYDAILAERVAFHQTQMRAVINGGGKRRRRALAQTERNSWATPVSDEVEAPRSL